MSRLSSTSRYRACYWARGDRYTFLVAGAQSNRAYFIMEGIIPPGGGPPLHIPHREEECFYLLEGTLGEKKINTTTGDFIQIPRGTVHNFQNLGIATARLLLFFSPAGMGKYFEEAIEPIQDRFAAIPPITQAVIALLVGAGPKHGMELV
jgi:quercetin dioxygenase-like cupin family protein